MFTLLKRKKKGEREKLSSREEVGEEDQNSRLFQAIQPDEVGDQ